MLAIPLILSLLLPQGTKSGKNGFYATRSLPEDRTLICLELRGKKLWMEHMDKVLQIDAFRGTDAPEFLDFIASSNEDFRPFWQRRSKVASFFDLFDRDMAFATVFAPDQRSPRSISFIGTSSSGQRMKMLDARIEAMLRNPNQEERRLPELEALRFQLGDSPLFATQYRVKGEVDKKFYKMQINKSLLVARRGISAGIVLHEDWGERETQLAHDKLLLGSLFGFSRAKRGGNVLVEPFRQEEGELVLARGLFRFERLIQNRETATDRARKEVEEFGFGTWKGLESRLSIRNGEIQDELRAYHGPKDPKAPSPFYWVKKPERDLVAFAEEAPASTLIAAQFGVDTEEIFAWLVRNQRNTGLSGNELATVRKELGFFLGSPKGEDGAESAIPKSMDVSLLVLPTAAGLMPEAFVLLRVGDRAVDCRGILERAATIMASEFRSELDAAAIKKTVRKYGRGDDSVLYVRFTDFMRSGSEDILMKMFGAGYLSCAKVGNYLIYGTHPRALRKIGREVAAGKTLAKDAQFQKHFVRGGERQFELYANFPATVKKLRSLIQFSSTALIPMMFFLTAAGPGGGMQPAAPVKPVMPKVLQLLQKLRVETVTLEKTDYGHKLLVKGGTLLSPTAWAGVTYGTLFLSHVMEIMR